MGLKLPENICNGELQRRSSAGCKGPFSESVGPSVQRRTEGRAHLIVSVWMVGEGASWVGQGKVWWCNGGRYIELANIWVAIRQPLFGDHFMWVSPDKAQPEHARAGCGVQARGGGSRWWGTPQHMLPLMPAMLGTTIPFLGAVSTILAHIRPTQAKNGVIHPWSSTGDDSRTRRV